MDIISSINKVSSEDLINIIKTRLDFLKKTYVSNQSIGYLTLYKKSFPYYGFITEFSKIIYDYNGSYYRVLNDDYIYQYLKYLKDNEIQEKSKAINYISSFLNTYLGRKVTRLNKKNMCFEKELISLNDINSLAYKNVSTSLEYAIISQNILSFLGYEPILIIGNMKYQNTRDFYAYNLIVLNDIYYLFDFYETVNVCDNKNTLLYKSPYKLKIDTNLLKYYFNGNMKIVGSDYQYIIENDTLIKVNNNIIREYSLGNRLLLEDKDGF